MENTLKISNSSIYNALLKYGYSKFSFTIIEYCEPEKCIERENFYLSSENHEYNILETAGSPLGRKHYEKTNKILSEANKGKNNPMYDQPKALGAGKPSQIFKFSNFQAIEVFDNKK